MLFNGSSRASFWVLSSDAGDTNRTAKRVDYYQDGDRLLHEVYTCSGSGGDGANPVRGQPDIVASNVVSFAVINPEAGTGRTNLPAWVDLRCDFAEPSCTVSQRVYFLQRKLAAGP